MNIYPYRCSYHKLSNDIQLISKECSLCHLTLFFPENQIICMECGQYRTKKLTKFKETTIKELFLSNNIPHINDKRVSKDGSYYRPDFIFSTNWGFLIVEVDEHQHDREGYDPENEILRMRQIYIDCQKVRQNCKILFIRYNPDNCINYPNINDKVRQNYLLELINYYLKVDNIPYQLTAQYLFYDDKNNNNLISID